MACRFLLVVQIGGLMPDTKLLIFDLDGTVNNSSPGIAYCYKRTGEHYGKMDITDDRIAEGLCGPFDENLRMILDDPTIDIDEAIKVYTKFYVEFGQAMSELFDGIKEVLIDLKERGYLIGLATLMADEYAKSTLENYGIIDYFDTVHGASFVIPYVKEDLIDMCIYDVDVLPEEAVMIGDGLDDYRASKVSGTDFLAATYGYELKEDFCVKHGLKYVNSPSEISDKF